MLLEVKREARELIIKALGFEIEVPLEEPRQGYGDLATAVCFSLAKKLKKPPVEIAEELASRIDLSRARFIERVEALNGFINFYLNFNALAEAVVGEILEKGGEYGKGRPKGERIILEHTSANPDGPLHIGHGRNAIIGDALARILRFSGYEVTTQYYLNDMGKQLAVVVLGLRRLELDRSSKPDHAIAQVYVEANKMVEAQPELQEELSLLMRAYEAGEKEVVEEFRSAAEYCLRGIKETLSRLGIAHDLFTWESEFVRRGDVDDVVERLRSTKYAREDGVLYLDLEEFGIEKELVLRRSDGTYLYATRDIAHHLWKAKLGKLINVWGADHKLLAKQLSAVLRILGEEEPEFIIYEFISLPGGKMSTRRGVFISLDELIDEAVSRAYAEVAKRRPQESEEFKASVAESVGIAAVRFNIVRISPEKAMVFRWEEALDFERQGAPFIQYAYARATRILEKAQPPSSFKVRELTENERALVKLLASFPEVVSQAAEQRRPSMLASYLIELATAFHRFYMFDPVLRSEHRDFRLNLVKATRSVLGSAMRLLGIPVLEMM
ncbi:MAG: arginine--tRNA ligase [Euryarchaeota archaeon]|nr:arginine--tRNA ligase [Euryarchaeota archaeon]